MQVGRRKHHLVAILIVGVHGSSKWQDAVACHYRCTVANTAQDKANI